MFYFFVKGEWFRLCKKPTQDGLKEPSLPEPNTLMPD
jgi:hypothetical protein